MYRPPNQQAIIITIPTDLHRHLISPTRALQHAHKAELLLASTHMFECTPPSPTPGDGRGVPLYGATSMLEQHNTGLGLFSKQSQSHYLFNWSPSVSRLGGTKSEAALTG